MTGLESTTEPAFEVEFGCRNCGADWTLPFRKKTIVDTQPVNRVYVADKTHDHFAGSQDCDYCRTITCPVCELTKHVAIEDRRPIDEES